MDHLVCWTVDVRSEQRFHAECVWALVATSRRIYCLYRPSLLSGNVEVYGNLLPTSTYKRTLKYEVRSVGTALSRP